MSMTSGSRTHNAEINVTPLIDILLVLLIIFMVITPSDVSGFDALLPQPPRSNVAAPAADALVQRTPPIAAASPALVGTGPAVSPTAHAAPALPAAAPPVVMPAAAASAS